MSIDHGVLNVPLHKRGNIDAEIDRHMAQQRREQRDAAKARAAQWKADKARALVLIDGLSDEQITALAGRARVQKRSVRKNLRDNAGLCPARVVKMLEGLAA
ncbi:hypothetical protein [Lysobacter sp. F6437]|uniref:hypothetical protein n=1 Tax=Lysobacter sp. F6437 TaxID=3459296 RepID=UPI00403D668C